VRERTLAAQRPQLPRFARSRCGEADQDSRRVYLGWLPVTFTPELEAEAPLRERGARTRRGSRATTRR
jgi:hypothetical protein